MAAVTRIPIDKLHPHPQNPRLDIGDVTELAESIKAKGVLQNLTVVPNNAEWTDFTIIIGHRRYAAAKLAGLTEVPCAVMEMTEKEQIQTMMVENMQRTDLTLFEQANGFQMMLDLGSPVDEISAKTGFSDTTVRRRLKWMELDREKLKEKCAQQISIADLDSLSQINDLAMRNECLDKIGTRDFDMAVQKAVKNQSIDENLPKVKAWLKQIKAKPIKDSERWSTKYDRIGSTIYIAKWGEDGNKPKDDVLKKPVFYWMGGKKGNYDYGELALYHEHEKAKPTKRPPEEIAREKAVREAWASLESTARNAYELRKKFVENLTLTKENKNAVLMGALYAGCLISVDYNSPDRTGFLSVAGLETGYDPHKLDKFWAAFDQMTHTDVGKLVYTLFWDRDNVLPVDSETRYAFPEHKKNYKLEIIYRWLIELGYEKSTEEDQFLSGDHLAFKMGEEYGEM